MNTDSKSGGTAAGSEFVMDLTKVSKKQEETPWLSQAERILLSPLFFYWNTALALYMMVLLIAKDPGTLVIYGNSELWGYSAVCLALAMIVEMLLVVKVYGWWHQPKSYIRTNFLDIVVLLSNLILIY